MVKVNVNVEVDRDGNMYGIVIGNRIDFIRTSRWMWNVDSRKLIYEIMKAQMEDKYHKSQFKSHFEEIIKEKFGENLEVDMDKSRVVDVQYLVEDDEIMVKYLLYTKPRKKEDGEYILGD
ncbi:MAG: hypothetical protein ACP5G1_04610, partial [Nanopusillaceae archaeon]